MFNNTCVFTLLPTCEAHGNFALCICSYKHERKCGWDLTITCEVIVYVNNITTGCNNSWSNCYILPPSWEIHLHKGVNISRDGSYTVVVDPSLHGIVCWSIHSHASWLSFPHLLELLQILQLLPCVCNFPTFRVTLTSPSILVASSKNSTVYIISPLVPTPPQYDHQVCKFRIRCANTVFEDTTTINGVLVSLTVEPLFTYPVTVN